MGISQTNFPVSVPKIEMCNYVYEVSGGIAKHLKVPGDFMKLL